MYTNFHRTLLQALIKLTQHNSCVCPSFSSRFLFESNTRKIFQIWANLFTNTLVFHCCQTPIWKAIQHENETTKKKNYTTVSQSLLSKIAKIENDLSSSAKYKSVKFAPKNQPEYQIAIYFPYKVFQNNKKNIFVCKV